MLKEYVVTLKEFRNLDQFYNDMETEGGDLFIPNREVSVLLRREISRSTHYMLTDEEAKALRQDSRVLSVEQPPHELGIVVKPLFIQEGPWDKTATISSAEKNWGLLRCIEGSQTNSEWGNDKDIDPQDSANPVRTGSVSYPHEGEHVDVIIIDGIIDPTHPEFAKNADGTGGSRVIRYNWLGDSGTYDYDTLYNNTALKSNNNHGAHVAGTVAGNTQGWARKANIYNLYAYGNDYLQIIDYVRAFHNSKPINPATGRKNPTICNNSFGFMYNSVHYQQIAGVNHLGQLTVKSFTAQELLDLGLKLDQNSAAAVGSRIVALEQDYIDAMNDGIIMVAAAGNDGLRIYTETDLHYNNYILPSYSMGTQLYYHRGMSPGATPGVICVASVNALKSEKKASFSNCGPRIDIFAPGFRITSSVNTSDAFQLTTVDPRDPTKYISKINGTSMASPQVAGVLACILGVYPQMTQSQAMNYITNNSTKNQIPVGEDTYLDNNAIQGAPNKYLFAKKERKDSGEVYPKKDYFMRQSTGTVYPRINRARYK